MGVGRTDGQQCGERGYIQGVVAAWIELDGVAGDQQEWRRGAGVAERLAQVGQHLAQVGARRRIGQFGPQQANQRITVMGTLGLDRQVGQQGARFVLREAADRLPIQHDLQGSQQAE